MTPLEKRELTSEIWALREKKINLEWTAWKVKTKKIWTGVMRTAKVSNNKTEA